MHKFYTAAAKSSGVLHRQRDPRERVPPTRKRVPSRVAQRTQVGAFTPS